jgi:hypothetical protein
MKLGFALFGIILLGLAFEVVEAYESTWFPPKGVSNFFIALNYPMHLSSMVYYFIETLTYIALATIIWFRPEANHFLKSFILLEFLDIIDFAVTGNTTWFRYQEIPITFNAIKVLVFGSLLAYELIHYFSTRRGIA